MHRTENVELTVLYLIQNGNRILLHNQVNDIEKYGAGGI